MRIGLLLFLLVLPSVGRADMRVASADYVLKIVDSIPKTNAISENSTDAELPTAASVWQMGALIRAELNNHMNNQSNPHNVNAEQVGLGNLKNVDNTNAGNITSGKLSYDRLPVGMVANTVAAGDDARFFGVPRTKPSTDAPDGMVWMWFE